MALEVGIVGLPSSGKSMLFEALTGARASGEVGLRWERELMAQLMESVLERAHASSSSVSRRRASARESLDLTVPLRIPRAAAVSSSESSRK